MAIRNYFDSNRAITENFQIEAAVLLIKPTEMLQ